MTDVREISETTDIELVEKLLKADKEKMFVVVQVAPAVRVLIGEKFGLTRGEDAMAKLSAALRAMGADTVVDTAIAQDAVTLAQVRAVKIKKERGGAPVTAGKDGSCKASPSEISARLLKKYYGEKEQGKSVRVVSVACCAKAKEKRKGADVVLTVDELAEMIRRKGMNLRLMKKSAIDTPFGVASGGAYICAASGGKAEAVARCLTEDKTRAAVQKLAYSGLYGKGAVREASVFADGQEWKFAVAACPEAAEKIRADIENGVCEYDFVEFTCGGCIGAGLENCGDKERTLRLRGLGLRYLDKAHAARSADMSSYAALALKEWEAMIRTGEACTENTPITEEELQPAPVAEEVIEEVVEETPVEEVVEEVVEETPVEEIVEEVVEETPVEEVVEEVIEETPVEEVVEEAVEEAPVEEVVEEVVEETPVEEVIEEVVEETPVEEVVEEVIEEAPVEEVTEETVTEEEAAFEDLSEEERAERDPYYRRLSSKERRKLKRKNKNNK